MLTIFFVAIIIVFIGVIFLFFLQKKERSLGTLNGTRIYQDSTEKLGETLYAKTINLVGKPDYIIQRGDDFIPVEVKTGRAPTSFAYLNHRMQLMAYCLLVEENFGKRPKEGVIWYEQTKKEFDINYTKEAEISLRELIQKITECKRNNTEFQCSHPQHNI